MLGHRLAAIVGIAAGVGTVAFAGRHLDAVSVRGTSMAPALRPGDRLLLAPLRGRPRPGQVVVVPDPRGAARELIKRVAAADAAGVTLHGDNPQVSTDARAFGPVPASDVRWRALLRYWPPSRIGPIPSSTSTGSERAAHLLSG